jgi:hypothetical protein
MVLGVIYMVYLYRTNPGRITDVGLVHLDEPLTMAAEVTR